jgi:phage repressor protein C with HTH and peptisase S24 domain/DNA-binding XRE family transcriptional regulator
MNIGDRVKLLREQKGMTQEELANQLGYKSKSSVTHIERGRDIPRSMVVKLADILDTTPAYLMGWEDHSTDLPEWISKAFDKDSNYDISEDIKVHPERYTAEKNPSTGKIVAYSINNKIELLEALFKKLNAHGQNVAIDRVEELTEIPKYQNVKSSFTFRRLSENRASAGCGYDLNDPDQWREIEVIDTPEARQADFAVEVEGASMEPDYHDGDIVYISLAAEIPVGQVGLFIQNGKGYIKEAGDGCIISRNPDYDDIYPEDGDIECKGRVIGTAELPV